MLCVALWLSWLKRLSRDPEFESQQGLFISKLSVLVPRSDGELLPSVSERDMLCVALWLSWLKRLSRDPEFESQQGLFISKLSVLVPRSDGELLPSILCQGDVAQW